MLTGKQFKELRVPESLQRPGQGDVGEDPRDALMRWIAAEGGDVAGVTFESLAVPGRDDNACLSSHPAFTALQLLAIAERQATKQMPPEEVPTSMSPPHPALACAGRLYRTSHRVEAATRNIQDELSRSIEENLAEREALVTRIEELDRSSWADYFRELKALQFRYVDPGVATGYFHDQRVPLAVRRTTALLFYLNDCLRLPLLQSIAMVGGLRSGSVPVDPNHPDLDKIFEQHENNLKRYRRRNRKSQGAHPYGIYLHPGPGGKPCSPPLANGASRARNKP